MDATTINHYCPKCRETEGNYGAICKSCGFVECPTCYKDTSQVIWFNRRPFKGPYMCLECFWQVAKVYRERRTAPAREICYMCSEYKVIIKSEGVCAECADFKM